MLEIKNLIASRENKQILNGIDLKIKPGEIHAIMGPNGSGKSTLASVLMGHPAIDLNSESQIILDGKNIENEGTNIRSLEGLFLAFQYPIEVTGVPYIEFLRLAYNTKNKYSKKEESKPLSPIKFRKFLESKMDQLHMDRSFLERNLNEGFSGGEKKKSEILQMAVLEPKYAILDETDSGLDVSALKIVGEGSRKLAKELNIGMVVITHYKRLLEYLTPDYVHVLIKGKVVKSGNADLADELDKDGYEKYLVNSQ